ncbi:TldD/PmbA family protein [Candidatus Methylacidiphilum fumarolicum]|nr:TldD/PmbA family protein [Candidatus Methylacidiphilum fumarolicum]MBW6415133.1 TldD/PmbA family protein [Candidatus Methylacidiphilum fumarolicum]TFE72716.1 TldD/PmbA family protein [Candidatus Methylacidiphilum fumarolicum]TFE73182.1 TldD/PmbA family protein [Candidatus Methylacidiphilum fumarolicum]
MNCDRRNFIKGLAGSLLSLKMPTVFSGPLPDAFWSYDQSRRIATVVAESALHTARLYGCQFSDIRICWILKERIISRENRIEELGGSFESGIGIRVLFEGTWGFASSNLLDPNEAAEKTKEAVEVAKKCLKLNPRRVELEKLPQIQGQWHQDVLVDPFGVPLEEKTSFLLDLNDKAIKAGADFCRSFFLFHKELRIYASSIGSWIEQTFLRTYPKFIVTVVDKKEGKFESRSSFEPPKSGGLEIIEKKAFEREVVEATHQAKEKLHAKSVVPGIKDLVLHPTNLWLTIHETIGHSTELDRVMGLESNYAGTSFLKVDQLGNFDFASPIVTIRADRNQPGGLASVGYDDDGIPSSWSDFLIIEKGILKNFQMAIGQAHWIGKEKSNGCSYAQSYNFFPIQRMPNISLVPSEKKEQLKDLISGVEDGIYIIGDGSWSIDQQRYNFQFGGQLFYEIKNGEIRQMLRDVIYQGNTQSFWKSCDGICSKEEYKLCGTLFCGKGEPSQSAPVSHGAVPARFRNITILNSRLHS